jgi:hypothetical protein|tara:strand:+ start:1628 stop:2416 length:789 start_codon:yes stop_codon:yes gene_type:complete
MIEYIEYIPQVEQAILPLLTAVGGLAQVGMSLAQRNKLQSQQQEAQDAFDAQKKIYQGLDTSNVYGNVRNRFQNLGNAYEGVENAFEDLTVNTQAAEFAAQQSQQSAANILQDMSGAAGGSGIGALAQALANQQTQAAQQASASIGQQEARNQMQAASAQSKIDLMTAQQANQNALMTAKGFADTDKLRAEGAYRSQQAEAQKQSTLLGMDASQLANANQAMAQNTAAIAGGIGSVLGGLAGGFGVDGKFDFANMTKMIKRN